MLQMWGHFILSKADKDKAMNYGVIARTIVLDRMVEQYLKKIGIRRNAMEVGSIFMESK